VAAVGSSTIGSSLCAGTVVGDPTFGTGSTSLVAKEAALGCLVAQEAALSCPSPGAHPVLGLLMDPLLLVAHFLLALLLLILLLVLEAPVLLRRKLCSVALVPVHIQCWGCCWIL